MKIFTHFALALLLFAPTALAKRAPKNSATKRQTPPQRSPSASDSDSSAQTKIDPAKEADIRQLLDLSDTKTIMTEIMNTLERNMGPLVTGSLPDGDYRDNLVPLFLERYHDHVSAEIQLLVYSAIPIYDKYFSREDIKGLIQFYKTPLGQKAASVLPKLSLEVQAAGMKMGAKLADQCMAEVLLVHPELQKALAEAQKAESAQ